MQNESIVDIHSLSTSDLYRLDINIYKNISSNFMFTND